MWKVLLAAVAIAVTSVANLSASAQDSKNLLFVTEDQGVKIYIHLIRLLGDPSHSAAWRWEEKEGNT